MNPNHGLNIKSDRSEARALVIFENTTVREVDVYWVDYTSQLVRYRTLSPGDKLKINTYKTHPWVFLDKHSGERMCVDHEEVYWPQPTLLRIDPRQRMIHRTPVKIHFPLRSLKVSALWQTVKLLSNATDIEQLEIPKSLIYELSNLFEHYQRYRHPQPPANDDQDDES